jgi:uncharacterized membrane protein HdeD (DUF308 family)
MIGGDIKTVFHQTKWALLLRGLFSLIIGVVILARPMESVAALALVIAIWALADGTINIVRAFTLRVITRYWWVMLLGGIVSVAFGIAALYYFPGLSLTFAVIWTAYWLIISGVVAAYLATQERRMGVPWTWTMVFGILAIVAGILAYVYPAVTLASLIGVIAGFAIIGGISLLMAAGRMQSVERAVAV